MTITELTENIQFTVDRHGIITAVVLSPETWQRIVDALEDSEDQELVHALQSRLVKGPIASGALRWQDVGDQWQ